MNILGLAVAHIKWFLFRIFLSFVTIRLHKSEYYMVDSSKRCLDHYSNLLSMLTSKHGLFIVGFAVW